MTMVISYPHPLGTTQYPIWWGHMGSRSEVVLYLPKSFFGHGFLQQKPKHGLFSLLPILPKSNGDSGISPSTSFFSPCCSLKPQINKKTKNHGTHADPLTSGAHTERPGHRPKPWPAGKKRWGHDGCTVTRESTVKHEMLMDVGYSPWLSNFRKTHDKIWQGDLGRLWGVKHLARCLEV